MHRRVSDRSAVCELCEAHGERVPGVVLVEGHVALDILNDPNDFYTGQELREAGQQHLDLTGEAWLVIERDPRVRSMPIGLWVVRPDRMRPVPSPTRFIAGYEYVTPDGETVPLALDDVIFIRMPNPLDPYRGMGPVQALLADLDSVRYSAEWNRNFFVNSAEPGGIIEAPRQLSDREFNDFITRWREQHQGVAQAHRVALLENMKWVERKYTMRDMQFAELRGVSREVIREAFALHKHKLGLSDDVNRANAEAADADFQAGLIVPRLKRWRGKLNQRFLPLFGETARDLELAFCSPVPEDRDAANAERTSKATAVKTYIEAKVPLRYALEQAGLPELSDEDLAEIEAEREREEQRREEQRRLQQERFVRPAPGEPAPGREPDGESIEDRITRLLDERERAGRALADWLAPERPPVASLPRNAKDLDPDELPDISHVQEAWERALAALLADWADVTAEQIDRLVDAVRDAISAGDIERLAALPADSERGAVVLAGAMESLARSAAEQVVDEAREQGVEMEPGVLAAGAMTAPASVTASLLAIELAVSAGRQALRLVTPAATPDDVA
ncbi:MAG TPA: phage portal protein, partial [Woeseiaceae bacterium]